MKSVARVTRGGCPFYLENDSPSASGTLWREIDLSSQESVLPVTTLVKSKNHRSLYPTLQTES